jgi:hypothetical protein
MHIVQGAVAVSPAAPRHPGLDFRRLAVSPGLEERNKERGRGYRLPGQRAGALIRFRALVGDAAAAAAHPRTDLIPNQSAAVSRSIYNQPRVGTYTRA